MDPVSLLFAALVKNPQLASSVAENALKPGAVDVAQMQGSLVDLSKGILTCYHKTARFRQTDVVATPWERAGQYGAEKSAILRITFQGMTLSNYQMIVVVMAKGTSVRSAVLQENTLIPYNKSCVLESWVSP